MKDDREAKLSAKPKRSGLIAVWVVLGLLIAGIAVLEGPSLLETAPGDIPQQSRLFDFTEPELGGIQAVYARQIASLMREPSGLWYQHDASHTHVGAGVAQSTEEGDEKHEPNPDQSAAIAERLARATEILVTEPPGGRIDPAASGLARSETMIAFYGRGPDGVDSSEPISVLKIGHAEPASDAYFARLDGRSEIGLIRRDDLFALLEVVFGEDKVPETASN